MTRSAGVGRVVGETRVDLRKRPFESNIGNLVCDAMRKAARSEVAIQNNGGLRTSIPAGKITMEQVYTLLPFDNNLMTMDLTGAQIVDILEYNAKTEGMLQVSGLNVVYDLSAAEGSRVKELTIGGKPADRSRIYRVTTNDFLAAGGDRFGIFREREKRCCRRRHTRCRSDLSEESIPSVSPDRGKDCGRAMSEDRMTVYVNGQEVRIHRGMKVKHALIACDQSLYEPPRGVISPCEMPAGST